MRSLKRQRRQTRSLSHPDLIQVKISLNREEAPGQHKPDDTFRNAYATSHMNFCKVSQSLKISSVLATICVLAASYPVKAQETQEQNIQSTPEILSVPCFDGGGSGGWMYEGLPDEYFPLGLITANEWPLCSVADHPMYNPDAPWNKYATCIIVPANRP